MVQVVLQNSQTVGCSKRPCGQKFVVVRKQPVFSVQRVERGLPKSRCQQGGQYQGNFEGRGGGAGKYGNYAKWSQYMGQVDPVDFWKDLIDLQDDLVDAMGGSRARRRGRQGKPTQKQDGTVQLPADFQDSDEKEYVIYADIPGLTKDDIKVQLGKDNELIISGERVNLDDKASERFFGKFSRSFILPEDADVSTITANVENGSLKITIRKIIEVTPEVEFKDIPIM